MKKAIALAAVAAAALLIWGLTSRGQEESSYRFVEIERGDVEAVVSSTGTLHATTTVEVGTQVSGQIAEILADFNERVEAGQLLARIDPVLLEQEVRASRANLSRSQAELEQAERELDRIRRMYERQVTTESEFNTAKYECDVADANLESAQVNLERARRNLEYTEIRSPIDGVVLDRTVDAGQTVAASLSAPQLFLIAKDLSEMEILASVDESDIGRIVEGQSVRFTVQAHPEESFSGTVEQVRLQSTMEENVVSYTAVVAVENPDGRLLPGMTATTEFIVERELDALKVANAALRFRPPQELMTELREQRGAVENGRPGGGAGTDRTSDTSRKLLWYLDDQGSVAAVLVQTTVSDGQQTVIEGPGIEEGMKVIAAVTTPSTSASTNPFQGQQDSQGRVGPPRPPGS